MHFDWNAVLGIVVAIAAAVLRAAIVTPKSHDVAAKIRNLADDTAAVILLAAPNEPWAQKLQAVINRLGEMLPKVDPSVLEKAATGALVRLGAANPVITITTTSSEPPTP
jgi:cell division protein FtsN